MSQKKVVAMVMLTDHSGCSDDGHHHGERSHINEVMMAAMIAVTQVYMLKTALTLAW